MKIKYYIFLVLLLILPFFVSAESEDISIKSVGLVEKSDDALELEEPTFESSKIQFNVKFLYLNDFAKYEVKVVNNSEVSYKISNDSAFNDNSYITYLFEYEDDSDIIEPNSEKVMYIKLIYANEVAESDYVDNVYKNLNYVSISFHGEEENPNTVSDMVVLKFFIVFLVLLLISVILLKKKGNVFVKLSLFVIIAIPTIINALNVFKIDISTYVEIEKAPIGTFSLCDSSNIYKFKNGMTIYDWLNSEYNTSNYYALEDYDELMIEGQPDWYSFGLFDEDNKVYFDEMIINSKFYECESDQEPPLEGSEEET